MYILLKLTLFFFLSSKINFLFFFLTALLTYQVSSLYFTAVLTGHVMSEFQHTRISV